jgi:lipoprotein signal peptidase
MLGFMGAIILVYHGYRAFQKLRDGKSAWVNWIHIFFVVPLLFLLARYKKDASRRYFEMLLLLGFSALGYHVMYLLRESMFT